MFSRKSILLVMLLALANVPGRAQFEFSKSQIYAHYETVTLYNTTDSQITCWWYGPVPMSVWYFTFYELPDSIFHSTNSNDTLVLGPGDSILLGGFAHLRSVDHNWDEQLLQLFKTGYFPEGYETAFDTSTSLFIMGSAELSIKPAHDLWIQDRKKTTPVLPQADASWNVYWSWSYHLSEGASGTEVFGIRNAPTIAQYIPIGRNVDPQDPAFNQDNNRLAFSYRTDSLKKACFLRYDTSGQALPEEVWYDFGLYVGDTFTFASPFGPSSMSVNDIDFVYLYGKWRKRIFFPGICWIEGIGSTQGLDWMSAVQYVGGGGEYQNELLCFFEDGHKVYSSAMATELNACFLPPSAVEAAPPVRNGNDYAVNVCPNPFNPATVISYQLERTIPVNLQVFNARGERVTVLVNGTQAAGMHRAVFEAKNLPSGLYLCRLSAGEKVFTRKLCLVK